jgi:hypothetical protein
MQSIEHMCRICKEVTLQITRRVSDLLPPNVHVLECTGCGCLGITSVQIADEGANT